MKLLIVGTGYVGLVTGACFASQGNEVLCVDTDRRKILQLQAGDCPIYEDGLNLLLQEQQMEGNIRFRTTIPEQADCDVAMIAVGTPARSDGTAELRPVHAVVEELAQKLQKNAVVAMKSTVPVGTGNKVQQRLNELGRPDLRVASTPEFLREGSALSDSLHPERLIFGVEEQSTAETLRQLHRNFQAPVVVCSRATAEMTKYASNAFLAAKISFINEIANICSRVDADVSLVAQGMGLDSRIGPSFLRAGLGYGGSCFPKDTRALVNIAGDVDYDFQLLKAVVEVNQRQRMAPLLQLLAWLGNLYDRRITILGVAFKPGTDDVRESPAVELGQALTDFGAKVAFYDPVVRHFSSITGSRVDVLDDAYRAVEDADAVVIVTEWPQIVNLDWNRVRQRLRQPFLYDGRNVLDPKQMSDCGFTFADVGRAVAPVRLGV